MTLICQVSELQNLYSKGSLDVFCDNSHMEHAVDPPYNTKW